MCWCNYKTTGFVLANCEKLWRANRSTRLCISNEKVRKGQTQKRNIKSIMLPFCCASQCSLAPKWTPIFTENRRTFEEMWTLQAQADELDYLEEFVCFYRKLGRDFVNYKWFSIWRIVSLRQWGFFLNKGKYLTNV